MSDERRRREIAALLGDDEEEEATPARPPIPPNRRPDLARQRNYSKRLTEVEEYDRDRTQDLSEIRQGVTVTWLASLYGIARKTVEKQLTGCPTMGRSVKGTPLYDLTIAAGYMSSRKRDIAAALKTAKEADLPAPLQRQFWQTKLLRNKWAMEAGEMWATDDVMDVLGEVFKKIKNSTMLWIDNLENVSQLTKQQRETLIEYVDTLNNEIADGIKSLPDRRKTLSFKDVTMVEIEAMGSEFDPVQVEDDDDE